MENNEDEKNKKDIEVIQGNGSDLDISPVYDHIKMDKTDNNTNRKEKIVIPKKKKN